MSIFFNFTLFAERLNELITEKLFRALHSGKFVYFYGALVFRWTLTIGDLLRIQKRNYQFETIYFGLYGIFVSIYVNIYM